MAGFRPYIVGIGGTTRQGSSSEKALRYALTPAEALGADVELFDGASINLPMNTPESAVRSEGARRTIAPLRRAHGVILSSPCYHESVSGLVKHALDYTWQVIEFARLRALLASSNTADVVRPRPQSKQASR
jgi:FMN reductase